MFSRVFNSFLISELPGFLPYFLLLWHNKKNHNSISYSLERSWRPSNAYYGQFHKLGFSLSRVKYRYKKLGPSCFRIFSINHTTQFSKQLDTTNYPNSKISQHRRYLVHFKSKKQAKFSRLTRKQFCH